MSLEKLCKDKLCSCQSTSKNLLKTWNWRMNGFAAISVVSKMRLAAPYEIIEVDLGDIRVCLKIISMWIALSNVHPPITPRTMHAAEEENGRITKVVCMFCHRFQIWRCLQQVGQSIKKWNRVKSTQSLIYYSFIIKLYIIFLEKYTIQQVSQLLVRNSDCINFEEISCVKITGLLFKQHLLCYDNEVQEVLFDDKAMTKRKPWISSRVIDEADISVRETPLLPSFHPG